MKKKYLCVLFQMAWVIICKPRGKEKRSQYSKLVIFLMWRSTEWILNIEIGECFLAICQLSSYESHNFIIWIFSDHNHYSFFAKRISREELFSISGIRGNYPQFFFVHSNGATSYFGNFDRLEELNETFDIPKDILDANPDIETWERVFRDVVDSFQ